MKSKVKRNGPTRTSILSERRCGTILKPLELLKRVVLSSTNEGDLVLDPFTGSSTTGVMSVKLGRKFIGIDVSEEYLNLSMKRLEECCSDKEFIKV